MSCSPCQVNERETATGSPGRSEPGGEGGSTRQPVAMQGSLRTTTTPKAAKRRASAWAAGFLEALLSAPVLMTWSGDGLPPHSSLSTVSTGGHSRAAASTEAASAGFGAACEQPADADPPTGSAGVAAPGPAATSAPGRPPTPGGVVTAAGPGPTPRAGGDPAMNVTYPAPAGAGPTACPGREGRPSECPVLGVGPRLAWYPATGSAGLSAARLPWPVGTVTSASTFWTAV
jgi:hypothetical protein